MAGNTITICFLEKLWLATDKLCGRIDAIEYEHVVLGLNFYNMYLTPSLTI